MALTIPSRKRRAHVAGMVAVVTAVAVAGCGSSGSQQATTTAAAATQATHTATPVTVSTPAAVKVVERSGVSYLVGSTGAALYLWEGDAEDKTNCYGDCASDWPPLLASGSTPTGGPGVDAAALSTITRRGGKLQVTYHGHPLYFFAGDGSSGTTNGQGSDGHGAKWWLVTPSGVAFTRSVGGAGASSTSTGSGW